MRRLTLIILVQIFVTNLNAQQLNVNETITYIQEQAKKYYLITNTIRPERNPRDSISIDISDYGIITIKTWIFRKGSLDNFTNTDTSKIYAGTINNFSFDYKYAQTKITWDKNKIEFSAGGNGIQMKNSINGFTTCCETLGFIFDIQGIEKINNAFNYLFDILKDDEHYNKKDNDPFSPDNYRKKILVDSKANNDKQTISLRYEGNLSEINVTLCGILKQLILDSGASDVTISSDTENELAEKGLITKGNYLSPSLYRLADGSVVKARRLIIPFIKVGSFTVKDVVCSVNPTGDIQLLGKSFLNRFAKWTIDNNTHSLILER